MPISSDSTTTNDHRLIMPGETDLPFSAPTDGTRSTEATDRATDTTGQAVEEKTVTVSPDDQLSIRRAGDTGDALHKIDRVLSTLRAVVSEAGCRPTCSADVVQVAALRAVVQDVEAVANDLRTTRREHAEVLEELGFIQGASELPF